jgi:hypothetical protein
VATIRTFVLAHDQARAGVAGFARTAPAGTVVEFREPTRTSAINAALHAKLGEIADTREWAGRRWDVETWKRLLVAAWSRATGEPLQMLPALDGNGVDLIWRRTSQMTQREVRELLAYIEAWEAETAPNTTEEKRA